MSSTGRPRARRRRSLLAERRGWWTPLYFAVDNGALDAAEALLDAGADIEARRS
ncbi:ankyrin repeat domain-containing protein [Amycolatopsis sulphurea]|uniref:ankyrin repeat domain-containing protein n=1 Tax=Amycolatopsis sulphurea TaxID=76022 RepID=UPI001B8093ED|nr:ankyrin repeat domain-containing protein [Amycolatopsis sulphurea]